MVSLETTFAVVNTALPSIPPQKWVELLSVNPRKIFGFPSATIREGNNASLTLFDPTKAWMVSEKNILSKSRNSPFIGKELTGKVIGIVNKNNVHIN